MTWREVVQARLDEIAKLADGWVNDGYMAAPARVIPTLRKFMQDRSPTPEEVFPTLEGNICCVWAGAGWDVFVEIAESGEPEVEMEHRDLPAKVDGLVPGQVMVGELGLSLDLVKSAMADISKATAV